jgi:hypothetical protein
MPVPATVSGGVHHAVTSLSHAERQAALNALSKLRSTSGRFGSPLAEVKHSATSTLIHGNDTFIGGARTSLGSSIGNDTVLSGSAKHFSRGTAVAGAHGLSHSGLSTDTINVAGKTAASVKAMHPEDRAKAHTVTLGDNTKVTISGLSTHDISKLHH